MSRRYFIITITGGKGVGGGDGSQEQEDRRPDADLVFPCFTYIDVLKAVGIVAINCLIIPPIVGLEP